MIHDIPAKSRLVPAIPITSPQFVYRQARETDVRATFARARAGLEPPSNQERGRSAPAPAAIGSEPAPRIRLVR